MGICFLHIRTLLENHLNVHGENDCSTLLLISLLVNLSLA